MPVRGMKKNLARQEAAVAPSKEQSPFLLRSQVIIPNCKVRRRGALHTTPNTKPHRAEGLAAASQVGVPISLASIPIPSLAAVAGMFPEHTLLPKAILLPFLLFPLRFRLPPKLSTFRRTQNLQPHGLLVCAPVTSFSSIVTNLDPLFHPSL